MICNLLYARNDHDSISSVVKVEFVAKIKQETDDNNNNNTTVRKNRDRTRNQTHHHSSCRDIEYCYKNNAAFDAIVMRVHVVSTLQGTYQMTLAWTTCCCSMDTSRPCTNNLTLFMGTKIIMNMSGQFESY